jgi:outer membrane protein assembly factor BamD
MRLRTLTIAALVAVLLTGCFGRQTYENPIAADTDQPDKVLYDKAINDLERRRYAVARLTLQTLINTYDTSEFLPQAKLALADSWYMEGGSHGLAQAEAEYKDFILFYPTMLEAAEAQEKVCLIHTNQMEKPDRDQVHAIRADDECRQVLAQFPNSQFAPQVEQTLRNVQEILAEHEFRVGSFYFNKNSLAAAINRHLNTVNHYPLYSKADEALYQTGQAYGKLGASFREQTVDAFQRIVRDYPMSPLAEDAERRLRELEADIPEPDPVALARMEYELENATELGLWGSFWGIFRSRPSFATAAKSGAPATEALRPTVPPSVPVPGATGVTAAPAGSSDALDTLPDARQSPGE